MLTRRAAVPYVLLVPLLLALLAMMVYPLFKVVENSFFESSFLNPFLRTYAGIGNYRWLFTFKAFNPRVSYFVGALGRTMVWVGASVTLKVLLGLAGAMLLNNKLLVGRRIYRTLVIVPWAIPWAAGAMMWRWTFNSQFGVINSLLRSLHIIDQPVAVLSSPIGAFLGTIAVDVWAGLPFMLIMLLSGLQTIPDTLYEAASIDGAGKLRKLFKITLPLMKPVILTSSLLSMIWTFNSFDVIWILTGGGPLRMTETLPLAIYKTSFLYARLGGLGRASAMTVAQVLIVSVLAVVYARALGRRRQHA